MPDQYEMNFRDRGEAFARNTDPETSQVAADDIQGSKANWYEQRVLNVLRSYPDGLTTHEISDISAMYYATVTPRMKPLMAKGLIKDSGKKRKSPFGKLCIVYQATTQNQENK